MNEDEYCTKSKPFDKTLKGKSSRQSIKSSRSSESHRTKSKDSQITGSIKINVEEEDGRNRGWSPTYQINMKEGGGKVVVHGFKPNLGGLFISWLLHGEGGSVQNLPFSLSFSKSLDLR